MQPKLLTSFSCGVVGLSSLSRPIILRLARVDAEVLGSVASRDQLVAAAAAMKA